MDTVGQQGSVALLDKGVPVLSSRLLEPGTHVVSLPQEITRLLREAKWRMEEVGLVAVTLGPGSFTGLRIALGVAKGLALGQQVAVIGLSTLEVVAMGSGAGVKEGAWIVSLLDARRKELFFELFRLSAQGFPESVRPSHIADPATLARSLAEDESLGSAPLFFNGSGLGVYGDLFQKALGDRFRPAPDSAWHPDPVLIGRLAQHRFKQRGADHAEGLQPLYLRRPDAVAKKRGL